MLRVGVVKTRSWVESHPMPKSTLTFMCSECGGESLRWAGQCPHCRAWNTLQEFQVRKAPSGARASSAARGPAALAGGRRPVPLNEIEPDADPRRPLAWGELNRVLGGGIVPGSLVLVGGEPGVGKSTLLMHAAQQIAASSASRPRAGKGARAALPGWGNGQPG